MEIICYKVFCFFLISLYRIRPLRQRQRNNMDKEQDVMKARKQDWHPADVIAALRKKGTSMAELSRNSGLNSSTLSNALSRP